MRSWCGLGAGLLTLGAAGGAGVPAATALASVLCLALVLAGIEHVLGNEHRASHRQVARPVYGLPLALPLATAPLAAPGRLVLLQATAYVALRAATTKAATRPEQASRVLLVASNEEAVQLFEAAAQRPARRPVVPVRHMSTDDLPVDDLAVRLMDLPSLCARDEIDVVLLGRGLDRGRVGPVLEDLFPMGVTSATFTSWFEEHFAATPLTAIDVADIPCSAKAGLLTRTAARLGTLTACVPLLVVLLLVLPLVATAILIESGRPVLFRQRRVGLHGRVFSIVKFRTMRQDAEAGGARFAVEGDPRTTKVGLLLRRSRIDELPQVLNMLRGEMALIGPRPERPEFVSQYAEALPVYRTRHQVLPGLTGWAQVTEGYTSSVAGTARKLERDLFYLRHRSRQLNARILARTCACVLHLSGR